MRLTIAAVAVGLGLTGVLPAFHAQAESGIRSNIIDRLGGPRMERLDQINPSIREFDLNAPRMRTVTLVNIPNSWIFLDRADSEISRTPPPHTGPGIGPDERGALYVRRSVIRPGFCYSDFEDRVVLSHLQRHGYTLVGARAERVPLPLTLPFTFVPEHEPRYETSVRIVNDRNRAVPPDQATKILIKPATYIYKSAGMLACQSAYRLVMEVRGPENVDPLTGETFTPRRVN